LNADLEAVYRENKSAMLSVALNITGCQSLAEDAIQNAFARIVHTMRNFGDSESSITSSQGQLTCQPQRPQNMKAYLFQSVRNAAIDIQRSTHRNSESRVSFFENEPLGNDSPTESAEFNEQRGKIRSIIEGLAESDRELVLLKIYSGFTFERIAQITQTSANTIATRYRRLLEKMKSVVKEKDD
jgi:RNA polymerase sigma-70 factor (ECF subfamily)